MNSQPRDTGFFTESLSSRDPELFGAMTQPYLEEYKPEPRLVELAKAGPGMKFFRGKGCPACNQTGYLGRIAIHEMLGINDRIRSVLAHDCDLAALRKAARDTGMMTLREDGLAKVKQGITTIDELLRIAV